MSIELIAKNGRRFAEVIRASHCATQSAFVSESGSSLQLGVLAGPAGWAESPHCHPEWDRGVRNLQEVIIVTKGILEVQLYEDDHSLVAEVVLRPGDAILLVQGIHGYRMLEGVQAYIVKQGPFAGAEQDKMMVDITR